MAFLTGCSGDRPAAPPAKIADWLAAGETPRFSEARLTGFPHAAWNDPGAPAESGLNRRRLLLEGEVETAVESAPEADSLRTWALLRLLHGQTAEGVEFLERSLELDPSVAGTWNDLAAAYFELSRRDSEPYFLTRSLSAALRARRLDPGLTEAAFNLALGYRDLGLVVPSQRFWERTLELETDAGFRGEAKSRLREALRPSPSERWKDLRESLSSGLDDSVELPRDLAQWIREWAMFEALPNWSGSPKRSRDLQRVGDWLRTHAKAAEVALAVEEIKRHPERREDLGEAFRDFAEGREALDGLDFERAGAKLAAARATFGRRLPAWENWCDQALAEIEIHDNRPRDGERRALDTLKRVDCEVSAALCGRLHWAIGLVALRSGRPADALDRFERARHLFDESHEAIYRGAIEAVLAETQVDLGRPRAAWVHRREGLRRLGYLSGSYRVHNLLLDCSLALAEDDRLELALQFQNEGVEVALGTQEPETLAEALQWRAKIHAGMGDVQGARADLEAAREAARRVDNPAFRELLEWDLRVAMAETLLSEDPEAAKGRLDGVVEGYRSRNLELNAARALLVGFRVERGRGRPEAALRLLESAVESFERQNAEIADPFLRLDHYRRVPELYDELIRLQVDQGRPERALLAADRKLRTLFGGAFSAPVRETPSLETWRGRIPPDTLLVLYAVTSRGTFSWAIDRDRVLEGFRGISAKRLQAKVRAAVALLRGDVPVPGPDDPLAELHADLVEPIGEALREKRRLLVAADGVLRELPFAALRRSAAEPPLVESLAVAKIPSVGSFLAASPRPDAGSLPSSALVVGDPAFDVRRLKWLPRLPGAAQEAAAVAKLYARSRLITDAAATRGGVLRLLPSARVFHFAGHALGGGRMQLLTAAAEGQEGAISAADLYDMDLSGLRVAVLSACSTGAGENGRGQGVFGLAHPFLSAGAGSVVATLWRVPDRPTRALALEFHRGLRAGLSPLEALRRAQNAVRLAPPTPGDLWAAFDLIAADGRALQ